MAHLTTSHLSLDLWDTILRRKCHPDEIKLHTAQYMLLLLKPYVKGHTPTTLELLNKRQHIEAQIGESQRQNGWDDEYEIEQVISLCIRDLTNNLVTNTELASLTRDLVQNEINQEISVTYLDRDLIRLIKSSCYKKLHIISDFYMSADKVKIILQAHSFPFSVETLFLSCDSKLNKRSGRLFQHVLDTLGIDADAMLHIGDNSFADVKMAKKSGLQAYHFTNTKEEALRKKKQLFFLRRQRIDCHAAPLISERPADPFLFKRQENSEQEKITNYGRYLSLLFTGFALDIQEHCHTGGHKTAFFFTREGKFFQQVFDRVQKYRMYGMHFIQSQLLPVSRLATFFPSLQEITPKEMMRIWSQYHTQSVNSFLLSLGVPPKDYLPSIRECSLDPDEMLHTPWQDEKFLRLLNNKNFTQQLWDNHQIKKERLINFFDECNFGRDGQALIVDIGWRGTIQDNLAHIFPNITIDGCYLGLQTFFNSQPENTRKYAYLANSNNNEQHIILKHVIPFEMLCFSAGGSATGYQRTDLDYMVPEFKCDPEEDRIYAERIYHFQQGVLQEVDRVCKRIIQHGVSLQEVQREAKLLATDFLNNPPLNMCKAFYALRQDDTFGMARTFLPATSSFRLSDRLLTYFSPTRRSRLLADLEQSGWPQSLLRLQYFGIFYILGSIKNIIYKTCNHTRQ